MLQSGHSRRDRRTDGIMTEDDELIKWKHFPRYWPFVRGIHRSLVNSPHKGQWRRAFIFFYLRLNKGLSKQSRGWWFETPSCSLWRHCDESLLSGIPKCTFWLIKKAWSCLNLEVRNSKTHKPSFRQYHRSQRIVLACSIRQIKSSLAPLLTWFNFNPSMDK